MMYEGDLRRCRRCKRKRMDDEPPEVQQYKTCAKCRIIERTKKKLRKPLAEETMRYGMRQFQEQNQNANFIHDDVFTADQILSDMQANRDAGLVNPLKQLYNTQFSVYKQPNANALGYNQQQYGLQGISLGMGAASPNYNYAQNYSYNGGQLGMSPGYPGASVGLSAYQLPLMGNASPYINNPVAIANAATAGGLSSVGVPTAPTMQTNGRNLQQVGSTSTATAAQIAAAAINRPDALIGQPMGFKLQQQYYRHYQQKQGDRSRITVPTSCELCSQPLDLDDSVSAIYRLCNTCYSNPYSRPHVYSDFNDFLLAMGSDTAEGSFTYISELASYLVESLNSNKPITSEQQFRKTMLDSFRLIYLDPLFASLSPAKLTQTSNNISELNNTVPIVSKVSQQNHYLLTPPLKQTFATADNGINIELMFVTETNLIIIKKVAKAAPSEFTDDFLKDLDSKMHERGLTFDDEASKVYTDLGLVVDAEHFAKNFKTFEKQIAELSGPQTVKSNSSQNGNGDRKANESEQSDKESNESDQTQATGSVDSYKENSEGHKGEPNGTEALVEGADPKEVDPAFAA